MRPLLLNLDNSLAAQERFVAHACDLAGRTIEASDLGPHLRLWSRPPALAALRARLRDDARADSAEMVFAGSGDFHHVTLLLLERALAHRARPVTLLHFDNHPDWVKFDDGLHCGSWMARAARLPGVARVISVGLCSRDIGNIANADLSIVTDDLVEIYPFHGAGPATAQGLSLCGRRWPSIASLGETAFGEHLAARIATPDLYITIDKDVLCAEDAVTNWDQGVTRLDFLIALIQRAASRARLIGADIVGDWSPQRYGGVFSALIKQGEALLDQPWRTPRAARAARINESANIALLYALKEAAG